MKKTLIAAAVLSAAAAHAVSPPPEKRTSDRAAKETIKTPAPELAAGPRPPKPNVMGGPVLVNGYPKASFARQYAENEKAFIKHHGGLKGADKGQVNEWAHFNRKRVVQIPGESKFLPRDGSSSPPVYASGKTKKGSPPVYASGKGKGGNPSPPPLYASGKGKGGSPKAPPIYASGKSKNPSPAPMYAKLSEDPRALAQYVDNLRAFNEHHTSMDGVTTAEVNAWAKKNPMLVRQSLVNKPGVMTTAGTRSGPIPPR